jgi:CRP-like cAMP-binding protein
MKEAAETPGPKGGAGILLAEDEQVVAPGQTFLELLNAVDRERVRQHGVDQVFERGQVLFSQRDRHDGIFLIESGLVRSFYTAPSGREITLAYWLPGNFVGGPEIFGGGAHMWTSVASRRSVVVHLPGRGLRNLAREIPDLALGIIDALVFKARCYSSLAQMLGTRSLSERLAHVLLHMAKMHGVADERTGGVAIVAAFTHAEIANLIGATRQWVTISLNRLQDQGILAQRRGMLVILKPDALEPAVDRLSE